VNALPTSSLLTGNKLLGNSSLGEIAQGGTLLQGAGSFESEFALLWQQLGATDGKGLPQALGVLQKTRPELLEQLGEELELAPTQLLALPAPAVEAINRLLQETPAFSQLIQSAQLSGEQMNKSLLAKPLDMQTSEKLLNAREQLVELLPQDVREQLNSQREQMQKEKFDVDLMRQISSLKLFTSDVEQALTPGALLREVQQGKVMEHLAGIDKLNLNVINPIATNALQSATQSQATVQLPRIDVPVGQAQWGQAVGERLMFMVNDKIQAASIILNPPELGPIEVKLNLNHDQASVHFVSNHAAVREAIEEAFPRLREMFAQNGLQLADANVSQQSAQQQQQQEQTFSQAPTVNVPVLEEDAGVQQDISAEDVTAYVLNDGLVDHYV